jgi:hypothetical protein
MTSPAPLASGQHSEDSDLPATSSRTNVQTIEQVVVASPAPPVTTTENFDVSTNTTTTITKTVDIKTDSKCKRVTESMGTNTTKRLITINISYKSEKQVGKRTMWFTHSLWVFVGSF